MDPIKIIEKYYDKDSELYKILIKHSRQVTKKALEIAKRVPELKPDLKFIEEAAMLHDIGIKWTNAKIIHCHGKKPYLYHITKGVEILEKEGLPKHALVCERHANITKEDIIAQKLALSHKNHTPVTVEEKAIALADLFYTKSKSDEERTIEEIKEYLSRFSEYKIKSFEQWLKLFKYN